MTDYLYLHGFNSSPQSLKARETAEWLGAHQPESRFHCPSLPVRPAQALNEIRALIAGLPEDTLLIGSSLGGFYAAWLAQSMNRRAVLINPAVEPHLDLLRLPRDQIHPSTGEHYRLEEQDLETLLAHRLSRPDPERFWLILGSADEVLDWRRAARLFSGCRQTVFNGDDHRLQRWPECLPYLPRFAEQQRNAQ